MHKFSSPFVSGDANNSVSRGGFLSAQVNKKGLFGFTKGRYLVLGRKYLLCFLTQEDADDGIADPKSAYLLENMLCTFTLPNKLDIVVHDPDARSVRKRSFAFQSASEAEMWWKRTNSNILAVKQSINDLSISKVRHRATRSVGDTLFSIKHFKRATSISHISEISAGNASSLDLNFSAEKRPGSPMARSNAALRAFRLSPNPEEIEDKDSKILLQGELFSTIYDQPSILSNASIPFEGSQKIRKSSYCKMPYVTRTKKTLSTVQERYFLGSNLPTGDSGNHSEIDDNDLEPESEVGASYFKTEFVKSEEEEQHFEDSLIDEAANTSLKQEDRFHFDVTAEDGRLEGDSLIIHSENQTFLEDDLDYMNGSDYDTKSILSQKSAEVKLSSIFPQGIELSSILADGDDKIPGRDSKTPNQEYFFKDPQLINTGIPEEEVSHSDIDNQFEADSLNSFDGQETQKINFPGFSNLESDRKFLISNAKVGNLNQEVEDILRSVKCNSTKNSKKPQTSKQQSRYPQLAITTSNPAGEKSATKSHSDLLSLSHSENIQDSNNISRKSHSKLAIHEINVGSRFQHFGNAITPRESSRGLVFSHSLVAPSSSNMRSFGSTTGMGMFADRKQREHLFKRDDDDDGERGDKREDKKIFLMRQEERHDHFCSQDFDQGRPRAHTTKNASFKRRIDKIMDNIGYDFKVLRENFRTKMANKNVGNLKPIVRKKSRPSAFCVETPKLDQN